MLFDFDAATADYIRRHGGRVVMDMKFRHAYGDGCLAGRGLLGSYAPCVRLGEPAEPPHPYDRTCLGGVILYHARGLEPKPGLHAIRIRVKSFAVFHWLELEGARYIPVFANPD